MRKLIVTATGSLLVEMRADEISALERQREDWAREAPAAPVSVDEVIAKLERRVAALEARVGK